MKKIFISLLAIAALASCAKTEDVFTEGESEIKLAPVTSLQTKANYLGSVDGIVYPTQENFDVYAYWKNVAAGQTFTDGSMFLEGAAAGGAEFTNKGNYWGGLVNYYWPKNGSLRFAAYSPAHLDVNHVLDGDLYTVAYEQPSSTAATWDFLVAPTSPSYSMMTATEQVAIEFQHALSWITLKVVAKDADAAKAFDITKVTINDVKTTADFAAAMGDGIQFNEWSNWDNAANYVVFEGSQMVTETLTDIENTVAGTLVIPQSTTSVTIDFDQYGINGTADTPGMTVTLDLVLDTDNTPWEPGKHYNYNLVFGLDEILINPSVADWTEVEVGELDVDASNVTTSAQFVAAVAKGGKVTLQGNVELDQAVTVDRNVVLELNGYTLSYTSAATGHNAMITVNTGAELIVKDCERNGQGKISYEYTGAGDSSFGWGSYTIANNGKLYVENGTIEIVCGLNGGSTNVHMYSAIHQGGNANSATVVSGGTVSNANYRSIRINQGSLKIYDGVVVEGQVWMHPFAANTSLEIVGGQFAPTGNDGSSVFVTNDSQVVNTIVSGGTFATKIGATVPTKEGVKGCITGGTFADATGLNEALIAEGYSLAQQGSVWTVVEGDVDVVAENFADLSAAAAAGENVLLADDVTITSIVSVNGGVLDGNGMTITAQGVDAYESAVALTEGTLKNVTVDGAYRALGTGGSGSYPMTGDVYYENVTVLNATYGFNISYGNGHMLYAKDCTVGDWNSYAGLGGAEFTDCTFTASGNYKAAQRIYGNITVTFKNCTFPAADPYDNKGYYLDGEDGKPTLVFENCKLSDGTVITADVLKDKTYFTCSGFTYKIHND